MQGHSSVLNLPTAQFYSAKIKVLSDVFLIWRSNCPEPKVTSPENPKTEKRLPASSLRKICCAILRMYTSKANQEICLKHLALQLKTERRRVYDIVNILEAFDVLTKKQKNIYLWMGLEDFKDKLGLLTQHGPVPLKVFNFEFKPIRSKKKMLTYMALRVLRFLGSQTQAINFGEIVRLCLCNDSHKEYAHEKRASTTRRLYDIVNVLNALGLISKIYDSQHKKYYRWNGREGISSLSLTLFVPFASVGNELELVDMVSLPVHERGQSETMPEIENRPNNQVIKERSNEFRGFQPCKEFGKFHPGDLRRLLSFSESDTNSPQKSSLCLKK